MRSKDKDTKSSHLRELEEVFDRRARRFSPFSILGLSSDNNSENVNDKDEKENKELGEDIQKRPSPGMGLPTPPMGGSNISLYRSDGPTPGVGRPSPGMGLPTPGVGGSKDPLAKEDSLPDTSFIKRSEEPPLKEIPKSIPRQNQAPTTVTLPMPEIVIATQIGTQLGQKAKAVLGYLNSIRSLESDTYTVPVGYGQISSAAQVDSDYLRRKVLPKLAMLGLLGVARKGLNGTVYHLPYSSEYIRTVAGVAEDHPRTLSNIPYRNPTEIVDDAFGASDPPIDYPEWLDKESWGWLSQESLQRLVDRAGSEAKAKEKLDIILYNENHGAPEKRVRNRRSVLAHYLSSANADVWPNDAGFETLEMKQLRQERDRAKEEKALAEEALRERQEATKAQFLSSLSDAQLRWLKQEAKRKVDVRPEAKFVTSKYPLYKAEEESLTHEWIDRVAYGETVPEA